MRHRLGLGPACVSFTSLLMLPPWPRIGHGRRRLVPWPKVTTLCLGNTGNISIMRVIQLLTERYVAQRGHMAAVAHLWTPARGLCPAVDSSVLLHCRVISCSP